MKKKPDCHQALRVTNLLFWSGFVLLILSIAVSGMADSVVLLGVLAILGVISITVGLVCGFLYVRCPSCGGSLMLGGRIPSQLPSYCPNCGEKL